MPEGVAMAPALFTEHQAVRVPPSSSRVPTAPAGGVLPPDAVSAPHVLFPTWGHVSTRKREILKLPSLAFRGQDYGLFILFAQGPLNEEAAGNCVMIHLVHHTQAAQSPVAGRTVQWRNGDLRLHVRVDRALPPRLFCALSGTYSEHDACCHLTERDVSRPWAREKLQRVSWRGASSC